MSITRFTSLDGFNDIIAGRDLAKIFENGAVYEAREFQGEIIIKKVGMSSITSDEVNKYRTFSQIMMDGAYLLTVEEMKSVKKAKQKDKD